jgi:hypothetical protein
MHVLCVRVHEEHLNLDVDVSLRKEETWAADKCPLKDRSITQCKSPFCSESGPRPSLNFDPARPFRID